MVSLSQKLVDALPLEWDGVTWDEATPGLGLRVQRGRKSWVVRYRVGGTQRQATLPGSMRLAEAQRRAGVIRADASEGKDRIGEGRAAAAVKRRTEQEQRDRRHRAVGRIVEAYLAGPATKLAPRTLTETRRYLTEAWAPLHDRDADALDRRTIVGELERIARERGPIASNRARSYLSMCLSFGVERGLLDRNALIGVKRLEPEKSRERVLSAAETAGGVGGERSRERLRPDRPLVDFDRPATRRGWPYALVGGRSRPRPLAAPEHPDQERPAP